MTDCHPANYLCPLNILPKKRQNPFARHRQDNTVARQIPSFIKQIGQFFI